MEENILSSKYHNHAPGSESNPIHVYFLVVSSGIYNLEVDVEGNSQVLSRLWPIY